MQATDATATARATSSARISDLIDDLIEKSEVDETCVGHALDLALEGSLPDTSLAGLLIALRTRRPTGRLLAEAARSIRRHALPTPACAGIEGIADRAIDTCGTGGDGAGTFNVSTAGALVAASCGTRVAKHGNRAVSSTSGSADVLRTLGIPVDLPAASNVQRLERLGFAFFLAPRHHPMMARVAGVRRDLAVRTIFNLLGPLVNPVGVRRQLVGVYAPDLTRAVAEALGELGSRRALVVHGSGLDELGLAGVTRGHLLAGGRIEPFELDPADVGLPRAPNAAFEVRSSQESAALVERILSGEPGAPADLVALNAGAALFVAERAPSVEEGLHQAREALRDGRAATLLSKLRARAGVSS